VRVDVRDAGPGIPLTEQAIIFEKFVRGAGARSSGVRGTGVGLALAREIVRAHDGDITVESVVGQGSTFTIAIRTQVAVGM
jgi:signal transduction histidine kinase